MTPGDYDTPPIDLGGKIDYAFAPDGKEIWFVRNTDTMIAISTKNLQALSSQVVRAKSHYDVSTE